MKAMPLLIISATCATSAIGACIPGRGTSSSVDDDAQPDSLGKPLLPHLDIPQPVDNRALTISRLEQGRNVHILPLSSGVAPLTPPHLSYFGGRVVASPRVIPVFWGNNVNGDIRARIGQFYLSFVTGPYIGSLQEYNTIGVTSVDHKSIGNQSICPGRPAGDATIIPANTATSLRDSEIQIELAQQINSGNLPRPDNDTIYMIYFPPRISIEAGSSKSCQGSHGFCAYHGTFRNNNSEILYGVFPDHGPGSGCDSRCGQDSLLDNITSSSSHELIETITDPEVGLATRIDRPLAWYDPSNGEIADICNQQHARYAGFVIQKEWSNQLNACVVPPDAYATRSFESGTTFLPETDGTWLMADHDRDDVPDLIFIKTSNTGTGKVEVHVASGVSGYQTRIFESATTFLPETDGTWLMADYDRDGVPDLIFIKTSNTGTGKVEVHVASGKSGYQTRIFESATTFLPETDGTWLMADYDRDGVPDLIFIKTSNTGTGKVEVHVASGKSGYQTRIFESATTFLLETDGIWLMTDYDRDGRPDLVFVKTSNTGTCKVEVHVASAASNYQRQILDLGTTFAPEDDGVWTMVDHNRDGVPDLGFIKTSGTGTGTVEVHIAPGN